MPVDKTYGGNGTDIHQSGNAETLKIMWHEIFVRVPASGPLTGHGGARKFLVLLYSH
jgi:hypothetical protein